MQEYWDGRFDREGKIWGAAPSSTAVQAAEIFVRHGVRHVLVPGAGYGRNANFLHEAGFAVDGIEIAPAALWLAAADNPGVRYFRGSVLDMPFSGGIYDAVYCFNVLHLFRRAERLLFLGKCLKQLKNGGLLYFAVFSEREPSFGRGPEVELSTFESKPGRPVHYFTTEDLREHFPGGRVLAAGMAKDAEDHGEEGPHVHIVRYICWQK